MNTMNNSEFLSITDENEMPSTGTTYGTGRTVAPNGEFDNLQLIFDCDTDDNNKPRSGCSVATNTQAQPPNVELSLHSSYVESNQYEQLPICQSYSDIDESIDIRSPKRSKFLSWFSKRFILPQIDGSPVQASLQSEALWSLNYREAAIYLEEGYNNDKFDYHPQTFVKLPAYLAVHNHLYYVIDLFACLLVLSLALFEKPARDGFHLSESIHASMELFGLAVIGAIFWIKYHWMGARYFVRHKRTMIKSIVLALMITEAVVVLLRRDSHFRVTRSLRPVFLIDNYYFGGVRRVIRQTIQSLHSFVEMLILLMFFLIFFSISAFYLFASVPNYEQFSTIWNSFISLYILLTTSNFPDVMMPAYKQGQAYVLFFIFFLAVNLYFLLNIMLAVVYSKFSQIEKDKFRKLLLHRRKACEHAFRLLVTRNNVEYVKFEHFCGLMDHLKPSSSLLERYLMYKALLKEDFQYFDEGSNSNTCTPPYSHNYLTLNKFYNVYEVMHLKWRDEKVSLPWFEMVPCLSVFRFTLNKLHALVTHRFFTYFTYAIILLATAYQLLDAIIGYERWQERVGLPTSATTVCATFIGLYTVEMCLKLLALGPREYFRHRWNWFDCLITIVSFTTFLLTQYEVTESLSTSLFSFRSLRLIDLLRNHVSRYRDILGPFAFIIMKRFTSVTLVVLIVYYFFAIIAMECFGGYDLKDCCKNSSIQPYYETTGHGEYFFYLNNFNDVITSFITLFALMMVNNWPVIMKAYVIVTGSQWTSLFFMIFFMVSLLVIAIVLSFVIDTIQFQIQYQHRFGPENLSAKVQIKVSLSREEILQISRIDTSLDQTEDLASSSSLPNRLLSSPFPPSWSFLKLIFQGQNFERMRTFNSSINLMQHQSVTSPASINMSSEELVRSNDQSSTLFRGTRFRDKFSYNLRMYSDEIQKWIQ